MRRALCLKAISRSSESGKQDKALGSRGEMGRTREDIRGDYGDKGPLAICDPKHALASPHSGTLLPTNVTAAFSVPALGSVSESQ